MQKKKERERERLILKCITGMLERKERTNEIFIVILANDYAKLMADTKPQIQKAQKTLNKINAKI